LKTEELVEFSESLPQPKVLYQQISQFRESDVIRNFGLCNQISSAIEDEYSIRVERKILQKGYELTDEDRNRIYTKDRHISGLWFEHNTVDFRFRYGLVGPKPLSVSQDDWDKITIEVIVEIESELPTLFKETYLYR
jgi:hypothetical protein